MQITDLSLQQKALLFAQFSNYAYDAKPKFNDYTFRKITKDNNVVFVLWDDNDIIIVARGTELTDIEDICTDASCVLVPSQTKTGMGHLGFETSAKELWPSIKKAIGPKLTTRKIWLTGHSLGGAITAIIAVLIKELGYNPVLFSYGCPRVGDKENTALLSYEHHRYVHCSDIVPRIPTRPFHHFGTLHYIDRNNEVKTSTWVYIIKDRIVSFFTDPSSVIHDHFIQHYIEALSINS